MGIQKLMLSLKMRAFGLHRHNYVSYTKPVNLILVSTLSIFLKRANWKKMQLFGNSEQLQLMEKTIIQIFPIDEENECRYTDNTRRQ